MKSHNLRLSEMSAAEKRAMAKALLQQHRGGGTGPASAGAPAAPAAKEVGAEHYRFEKFPGYQQLREQGKIMESIGVDNPYFNCHQDVSNNRLTIDGKSYINFSGYNYLGLSGDPRVSEAAKSAIDQYGTSVSASRIVSGDITLHRELESEIAGLIGAEACVVYVSGYGTNVSTIGHLLGPKDLIVHDALIHNSLMAGCVLSGARRVPFPHNDWQALDRLLRENREHHEKVLIIIEGVYSMDGDIPDLPRFIEIKNRHRGILMVDEAHSIGVLGAQGRGIAEYFGIDASSVDIWMGTLSKALASCGGYIAGSRPLIENLKYNAPGGVLYSVGLSPANAGAAMGAIRALKEEPERVARLQARARLFLAEAKRRGLDTGPSADSPVVPVILGSSMQCLKLGQRLFEEGINVQAVLYPAVPEDASRLRFFITAMHTEEEILYTLDQVRSALNEIQGTSSSLRQQEIAQVRTESVSQSA